MIKPLQLTVTLLLLILATSSCTVGPKYQKPPVDDITPGGWHWKIAEPGDALPKGEWWTLFHDPVLNQLAARAVTNNQNLRAALARVDQSRAIARLSRSQIFPDLSLNPVARRERTSGNLPTPIPFDVPSAYLNTFATPLDLSYEVDLWGRVRRSFESARADAAASLADYQNVLLMLTADVAVNYFLIRSLEAELATLRRTLELREESVRLLRARFGAGALPEVELAQAQTEAASTRVELSDVERQRAEVLHALALLCGQPAGSLQLPPLGRPLHLVTVPPALPSELLERRPDIARAERALAARNAEIGVARAAYFPVVRLTGQAGYLSAEADDLFTADSRVWSIGPGVSIPLFNAGRTRAQVKRAEASYDEALAGYRQTVLAAFKDVEDSLAQIVLRQRQASALDEAVESARRVLTLAQARYEAGSGSFLQLLDAERTLLQHQRQYARLEGLQLAASVRLIKALGGGWPGISGKAFDAAQSSHQDLSPRSQ